MPSKDTSPQKSEILNRCEVTPLIIERDYNIFMPLYDRGIDFILHREKCPKTFFVQLKGRFTVDKKYRERGIHLLFPNTDKKKDGKKRQWYLVEHDKMIELAKDAGLNIADSKSWKTDTDTDTGQYSIGTLSSKLLEVLDTYKLEDVLNNK